MSDKLNIANEMRQFLREHLLEDQLWGNIRRAARTNPALQDVLDRAIMIYNLSKTT